jgi:hypothetical protein
VCERERERERETERERERERERKKNLRASQSTQSTVLTRGRCGVSHIVVSARMGATCVDATKHLQDDCFIDGVNRSRTRTIGHVTKGAQTSMPVF